ncbi:MAG: ribosomal RNA small subunit methyltransferase A [Anaerolineales bacterium]|nr:ribosomal RNA small subunit methyltransferase A [Anaerolineales bacterium]
MVSQLSKVKETLKNMDRRARKGLGQHFLVDSSYLKTISAKAELSKGDTVIEVGPGLGVLTEVLLEEAGHVIAVEVDAALTNALTRALSESPNLILVNADILKTTPEQLLDAGVTSYKVVANLPYNIASPVLRRFLEARFKPSLIVVMVQREVAKNMMAKAPDMNLLAIGVQLYGRPKIVRKVPPDAFYPRPKVESAIVRIDVYNEPSVEVGDIETFFRIARAGFGNKRKQLRNSLAHGLDISPKAVEELLHKAGISHQRRAQTITLNEWAIMSRLFGGMQ